MYIIVIIENSILLYDIILLSDDKYTQMIEHERFIASHCRSGLIYSTSMKRTFNRKTIIDIKCLLRFQSKKQLQSRKSYIYEKYIVLSFRFKRVYLFCTKYYITNFYYHIIMY